MGWRLMRAAAAREREKGTVEPGEKTAGRCAGGLFGMMSVMTSMRRTIGVLFAMVIGAAGAAAEYRVVEGFPQLPQGVRLAGVSGVAIDSKGEVYVFHRGEQPILVFES